MAKQRQYRGGLRFAEGLTGARKLRREQTPAEVALWERLRDRQVGGAKFRRQHSFGPYVCDFYCAAAGLVVECDGGVHGEYRIRKHDWSRERYMKSLGLVVVRVSNEEVLEDVERVVERIGEVVRRRVASLPEGERRERE